MRQLMTRHRGMTLIELMATLAIAAVLFGTAAPYLGDYINNTRMRQAGNSLLAEALHAQGDAIKRNASTRLSVAGGVIQVLDISTGGDPVLLRSRQLSEGLAATSAVQVDFGSRGTPLPFGTGAAIDLARNGATCSAELRCPGLRIDGGGGIRLCVNRLANCT